MRRSQPNVEPMLEGPAFLTQLLGTPNLRVNRPYHMYVQRLCVHIYIYIYIHTRILKRTEPMRSGNSFASLQGDLPFPLLVGRSHHFTSQSAQCHMPSIAFESGYFTCMIRIKMEVVASNLIMNRHFKGDFCTLRS